MPRPATPTPSLADAATSPTVRDRPAPTGSLLRAALLLLALALLGACASPPPPEPVVVTQVVEAPPPPDLGALIESKDTAGIRQFFGNRDLVDVADKDGLFPLHRAVEQNAPDIVEILLAIGSKPDPVDGKGRTPLRIAVDSGYAACAKALAERGASLFAKDASGMAVGAVAVAKGGELLSAILSPRNVNQQAEDGRTLLHLAADGLYENSVERILGSGATIALRDKQGRSALDYALLHPDRIEAARIAESLIVRGLSPSFAEFSWFAQAARSVDFDSVRFEDGNAPLHEATLRRQKGFVEYLLARRANPNIRNGSGSTPLHEAVRSGWLEGAALLLKNGADPNARDGFDNTSLHIALPEAGRAEGIPLLLRSGADPSLKDRNGNIPLHIAVQVGYPVAIVDALLAAGSAVNAANAAGDSPLIVAVRAKRYEYAAPLLAKGADIFLVNGKGESALSIAVAMASSSGAVPAPGPAAGAGGGAAPGAGSAPASAAGGATSPQGERTAALSAIINAANVGARDNQGNTPLALATIQRASSEALGLIIARGGDPNARNNAGDAALHHAVRQNLRIQGEALLGAKADIYAANVKGETPLSLALLAKEGPVDWLFTASTMASKDRNGDGPLHHVARRDMAFALPYLGQKGADPAARNADGETALAVAVKADAAESTRALLALGSPLDVRDAMGDTPLHAAVLWTARTCLPLVLDAGADPNPRNLAGETPLHQAVKKRDPDSLRYLLQRGADTGARDNRGSTALALAARSGAVDLVGLLLEAKADPDERDLSGKTALRLALDAGELECARLVETAGGDAFALDAEGLSPLAAAALRGKPALEAVLGPRVLAGRDSSGNSALRVVLDSRPSAELVDLLLAKGARHDLRDRQGRTVLHAALVAKELAIADRLAAAGADLFAKDRNGESPLSLAITAGPETLKALLGTSRVGAVDQLGNGPLHYAALAGSSQAAEWLLANGAERSLRNISGESASDVAAKRGNASLAAIMK